MSNYGFEVELNGERLCNAGIDNDYHVVTCILTSLRRIDGSEELDLIVTGSDFAADELPNWASEPLKEGDTITIKVTSSDFDPPRSTRPKRTEEEELSSKLQYYHRLKEELKAHLDPNP